MGLRWGYCSIRRSVPNGKCRLYQRRVGKCLRVVAQQAAGRRVDLLAEKAERPAEVCQIF
jgi:hypothetical protein